MFCVHVSVRFAPNSKTNNKAVKVLCLSLHMPFRRFYLIISHPLFPNQMIDCIMGAEISTEVIEGSVRAMSLPANPSSTRPRSDVIVVREKDDSTTFEQQVEDKHTDENRQYLRDSIDVGDVGPPPYALIRKAPLSDATNSVRNASAASPSAECSVIRVVSVGTDVKSCAHLQKWVTSKENMIMRSPSKHYSSFVFRERQHQQPAWQSRPYNSEGNRFIRDHEL